MDPKFLIFFITDKYWLALFRGERNPYFKTYLRDIKRILKLTTLLFDGLLDLLFAARQKTKYDTTKKEIQKVAIFTTILYR